MAWTLLTADLLWLLYSIAAGFPTRWETIFHTVVAAITLALVFVIQHTQAREQLVTQRKLDEILQALPRADNALIGLEEASGSQLATIHAQHLDLRADAVAPAPIHDRTAIRTDRQISVQQEQSAAARSGTSRTGPPNMVAAPKTVPFAGGQLVEDGCKPRPLGSRVAQGPV